jgi:hypothetical protein
MSINTAATEYRKPVSRLKEDGRFIGRALFVSAFPIGSSLRRSAVDASASIDE